MATQYAPAMPRLAGGWTLLLLAIRCATAAGIVFGVAYSLSLRASEASLNHLFADIRRNLVTDVAYVSDYDFGVRLLGPNWSYSDGGNWVVWHTVDGSRHAFRSTDQYDDLASVGLLFDDVEQPANGVDLLSEAIDRELARQPSGVRLSHSATPMPDWLIYWAVLGWAVVFATLVAGPQPRFATKWGWFWLLAMPFGLGFLALLVVEAPWSRRASARPEPLPHVEQRREPDGDGRLTGGRAALVAFFLVPIALSVTIFPLLNDWLRVDLGW